MKLEEKVKEVKKKVVEKVVDKGLEYVAKPVKEAIQNIEERLNSPTDETVNAVGELTTAQQLLAVAKKYGKEAGYNALKKGENLGIAALNLIPVLGTASQDLVDAAVLEGATVSQAKALATGAEVIGGGEVAYPLTHVIGEKAAAKLGTVLKALDPFEDIDPRIVAACGAVGLFVPGVGAVPSGIEVAILTIKDAKNAAWAVKEAGSIITKSPELQKVKDFTSSVVQGITNKINSAGGPRMGQARAAFGVA